MMNHSQPESLHREDYMDPQCPFCTDQYQNEPQDRTIPIVRILDKLDSLLSRNDYSGGEHLLLYWLEEAKLGHDLRGEFQLSNELMGLYRKLGQKDRATEYSERVLFLIDETGISDTTAAGTAYVNTATVRKAFGRSDEAIPLFEKAKTIYERELPAKDPRLAGLYNNMALALTDLKRFPEARNYYQKALSVLSKQENSEPEAAITYLNLANLEEAELGLEDGNKAIEICLAKAREQLDSASLSRDGNYAFVCEKCAPTFDYYGQFAYAAELTERANSIYARN